MLCELVPYVNNIAIDDDLLSALKEKLVGDNENITRGAMLALGAQRINLIVPIILKKHRKDVFGILSVLNEISVERVEKQNIIKTLMMIREIAKDEELICFFKSCAGQEKSE